MNKSSDRSYGLEPSPNLAAALDYASRGWPVFPVHTVAGGQCSCGKEDCPSPGKHPRTPHGHKDATADETQIRSWWAKYPDANVAIVTGAQSGLVVLDIDPRNGGNETMESLEVTYGKLPHTVEAYTGGGGRHLFFKHPGKGTNIRNSSGKILGPGLDIRGDGGYVVAPPSLHASGQPYCWEVSSTPEETEVAELPTWLAQRLQDRVRSGPPCDPSTSKIPEGQRNDSLFRIACGLRRQGIATSGIEAALNGINHTNCDPPLGDKDVRTIAQSVSRYSPIPSPDTWLQDMNKRHAVVMVGGKCLVLNEIHNSQVSGKTVTFSSPTDFKHRYQNQLIPSGKRFLPKGQAWFKHPDRRQYQGICFVPGKHDPTYYNLWQGFAVTPKPGDCSLYLVHLKENIAQGDQVLYDYILGWMAYTVQFPDQRLGVALVLRGKQGTGKGVMCLQFGKLFGQHFIHVQRHAHLLGHFNAHFQDKLVVFADEAFWAGNKSAEGALKAMVTEEQIPIESKGKDVIQFQNHIHLLIASNHDWVVPAGPDERRFCVLDVGEKHIQDHAYFEKLIHQMDQGGREALLYFLLHYDVSDLNLRKFPQTKALQENKLLSMSSVEKFWYERLQAGALLQDETKWIGWVVKGRLHAEYVQQAKDIGQSRKSTETELGMALKKLVPGLSNTHKKIGAKREPIWRFPDLKTCRKHFDEIMRFQHEWQENESQENRLAEGGGTC